MPEGFSATIRKKVRVALLTALYRQASPLSYYFPLTALLLYLLLFDDMPALPWSVWLMANLLVAAWRYVLTRSVLQGSISPTRLDKTENLYLTLEVVSGFSIGMCLYFVDYLPAEYQILLYLLVIGTNTGSVVLVSSSLRTNIGFILTNTCVGALWLLLKGEIYFTMLAIMGLAHALLMVAAAVKMNQTLHHSFALRYRHEDLLEEKNLVNTELRVSKAQLEEAYSAKSRFLSNMSHEIRTPLNAIVGVIELLKHNQTGHLPAKMLDTAASAAQALLKLLNNLLDLSRYETHTETLEEIPFDLDVLVKEVVEIHAIQAEKKALVVSTDIGYGVPTALIGDPVKIRQVLDNLVANAVKFTPRGHIDVRVSCIRQTATDSLMLFEVADTGVGIAPKELDNIFKPFTQADDSVTREYGGTGLGLSIVRQLTIRMDGECGVRSVPGKGSTFWVRLPCRLDNTVVSRSQHLVEKDRTGSSITVFPEKPALQADKPLHVLLVEDNEANQLVAKWTLEHLGLIVSCASNGLEALDQIQQSSYDLIFMDCQMPVMDGFAATERLRQTKEGKQLYIIAMTANSAKGDRERCLSAGMNGYIPKPFQMETISAEIKKPFPAWSPKVLAEEVNG